MFTKRRVGLAASISLVVISVAAPLSAPADAAQPAAGSVVINEIESSGGTPGDWVELFNPTGVSTDVSGFVFKDADDSHTFVIPPAMSISAGGYLVLDEAQFGFGLGAAESARLFAADGTTLVDSYSWLDHAPTTYGRCPNGSGSFTATQAVTKGTVNVCPGDVQAMPWPGRPDVQVADDANVLGGNISGLAYEGSGSRQRGVLWAVKNGPGMLFRLLWNGFVWSSDTTNGWAPGKVLHYPDGTGDVDAEGVTFTDAGPSAGLFVSSERNNAVNAVSRNAILRFDPSASGSQLSATAEWNLTADLPANGPNLGIEAITWVPDSFLVSKGMIDESSGQPYDPTGYPDHTGGVFLVGVEATGVVYAYVLDQATSGFTKIATIDSGFNRLMELQFDPEREVVWAVCDDGCQGRTSTLQLDAGGKFVSTAVYERPLAMPNLNNEGLAVAPQLECVDGFKPVYWADDANTDGHALRSGMIECTAIDLDADDDGILDQVDADPANPGNNSFSDVPLGGNVSGVIVARNGHAMEVSEAAPDGGVRIVVGPGAVPVTVRLLGRPTTIELTEGTYMLSRGTSTQVDTMDGEAIVVFSIRGTPVTFRVGSESSLDFRDVTGLMIRSQTGAVTVDGCGNVRIDRITVGGNGPDRVTGTPTNDLIITHGGDDRISSGAGSDCVEAGDGSDVVTTGGGRDLISAAGGDNRVAAGGGNDLIFATGGDDRVDCGVGIDAAHAGLGRNANLSGRCEVFAG